MAEDDRKIRVGDRVRRALAQARPDLVLPVPVDPTGVNGPTRKQVRGSQWRRSSYGLYLPATVDAGNVEQRIVEAAVRLPRVSGVTGWAALRWMGGTWFDGTRADGSQRDVMLLVGDAKVRRQPGVSVCQERRSFADWQEVDGLVLTCAAWAVAFEMRYAANMREAAVAFEMAAFNDLISRRELAGILVRLNGWTGVPQARRIFGFLDENSWSPQETRLRYLWSVDAELPTLLTNRPLFDRWGHHIATPDLLDEEAGLAIEYDGAAHFNVRQRRHDAVREERMRAAGLDVVRVVAGEQAEPGALIARLRAARQRALFAAPRRREWSIEPPPGWNRTWSVEQRRALSAEQATRYLRHRRRPPQSA